MPIELTGSFHLVGQSLPGQMANWRDRLSSVIDDSLESMDVADRLTRLKESVSNASEHIINLIVIFVLQTIILPLVFVWLLVEALKGIAARSTRF